MAASASMKCVKFLLFAFNIAFWMLGLTVFVVGVYVLANHSKEVDIADFSTGSFGGLLVTVGLIAAVVGFAGCYGAMKEKRFWLIFYTAVVAIIFLMEIIAGGIAFHYRNELEDEVKKGMNRTLARAVGGTTEFDTWNKVQTEFKCCGVENFTDWYAPNTQWSKTQLKDNNTDEYPYSCCRDHKKGAQCVFMSQTFIDDKGCYDSIYTRLRGDWRSLAAAALVIGLIQIFGIVFGCCLQNHVKNQEGYKAV